VFLKNKKKRKEKEKEIALQLAAMHAPRGRRRDKATKKAKERSN